MEGTGGARFFLELQKKFGWNCFPEYELVKGKNEGKWHWAGPHLSQAGWFLEESETEISAARGKVTSCWLLYSMRTCRAEHWFSRGSGDFGSWIGFSLAKPYTVYLAPKPKPHLARGGTRGKAREMWSRQAAEKEKKEKEKERSGPIPTGTKAANQAFKYLGLGSFLVRA